MGWQEDEANVRKRKQDTETIGSEQTTIFWEKLKKANNELIPGAQLELKSYYDNNNLDYLTSRLGWIQKRNSDIGIRIRVNTDDEELSIFYSPDSDSLLAHCGRLKFEIDDNSPAIIIRNACRGISLIHNGLKIIQTPFESFKSIFFGLTR